MRISNGLLSLSIDASGHNLRVCDDTRGEVWRFDESTLVCDAAHGRTKLTLVRAEQPDEDTLRLVASDRDQRLFLYDFSLGVDFVEVTMPIANEDDAEASGFGVSLPTAFDPESAKKRVLVPIMQGMLWSGGGPDFESMHSDGHHTGFSLGMGGTLGARGALLAVPDSIDDMQWWLGKRGDSFWCTTIQRPSLGSLRYSRTVRLFPTDSSIVALARRYRMVVKERGRFRGWEEKLEERPDLERLFGALWTFIGYCRDDIDYAAECAKLKAYGFDRAMVYPVRFNTYHSGIKMGGEPPIDLSRDEVARIKSLGYDVAPWSWLNEAMDDGSDRIRSLLRDNIDGEKKALWAIEDQQWYEVCSATLPATQAAAIESRISDLTWDHFDVVTCASNAECYATDHLGHPGRPLSRREDREWLRRLLRDTQRSGRAVSSENFNDAYGAEYDIGSVKAWPQFGPWPFWPVPLTSLVYHDSMIHSWWEVHNYNAPQFGREVDGHFQYGGGRYRLQACYDALSGSPPDVFPFGAQYGWTGKDHETYLYKYRFDDPEVQLALQTALPVARLHRRIGKLEMTGFEILSEDGYLQRSTFADGTSVVVNFGSGLRQAGDVPLQGESWKAIP